MKEDVLFVHKVAQTVYISCLMIYSDYSMNAKESNAAKKWLTVYYSGIRFHKMGQRTGSEEEMSL